MKTMSFKKVVCMLLCVASMGSMTVPAWAVDIDGNERVSNSISTPSPRYNQTAQAQSRLKIVDGTASAFALVVGSNSVTEVSIDATLQKKVGGRWSDVESWSESSPSDECTLNETASVGRGTYRLHVSFTTYAGSKEETGTVNSNTVTY